MGLFARVLDSEPELGQSLFIFWDVAKDYPKWLYNGNKGYVWPQVVVAIGSNLDDRQDIILQNGNTFSFTSKRQKTDSDTHTYNLEIYCNKKIVASLYTQIELNIHTLSGVEFINDGVWTREIFNFLEWKKSHDEKKTEEIIE